MGRSAIGRPEVALRLNVLDGRLAVCRLKPDEKLPTWATQAGFFSVTRAPAELSVVCSQEDVPEDVKCEKNWRTLQLEGPFEFSLTGILLSVLEPLAGAGVGIFAISTFDTDYVLVKDEQLKTAVSALRESGHEVWDGTETSVVVGSAEGEEDFLWEMLYEAVHWSSDEWGPKPPQREIFAEPRLRRYLANWGRRDDFALVARDERGRKLGAAWYRIFPESEPGYGFVDAATPELAIAVVSDLRGTGVGGVLLQALMGVARSNGFDAISLSVQKSNHAATKLYETCGFVPLHADGDDWVMRADLSTDTTTKGAPDAQRTEEI